MMSHTLEQFATRCHDMLKAHPGPAGRQQVCTLLQEVLQDDTFVTTYLGDDVPERQQFPLSVSASTVFWPFDHPLGLTAGLPAIISSKIARA